MKKLLKTLSIFLFFMALNTGFAQTPPPPNNNNGSPGGGNTPVGGGAPIGGGIVILVSVALAYGYAKYYLKKPDYTVEEES
ncbi:MULTISPECIES: hypothetical protein [unclassified Lentimicrobium]|uniref:hypothetical protein n=1 Tax=unclassified Lentimicrobium TaxID=2677434 RepID=UPI00155392CB|nr:MULTISPECIES: hypothetical protein [unclassified Lentimicrobium]NPD44956.1 hypothetical protein [Lentimicrobium sp. S6]NPD83462.1 hypothetical protein [Lentimicrobium sp. L6]